MSDKKGGDIGLRMRFGISIKRDEWDCIEPCAQTVLDGKTPNTSYICADYVRLFVASALEAPLSAEIRLSAATIASRRHHKEATAKACAAMPFLLLRQGSWVRRRKDGRVSVYREMSDKIWELGIKRTKKAEIYIPTMHYCERRKYEKMLKEEILDMRHSGR